MCQTVGRKGRAVTLAVTEITYTRQLFGRKHINPVFVDQLRSHPKQTEHKLFTS